MAAFRTSSHSLEEMSKLEKHSMIADTMGESAVSNIPLHNVKINHVITKQRKSDQINLLEGSNDLRVLRFRDDIRDEFDNCQLPSTRCILNSC